MADIPSDKDFDIQDDIIIPEIDDVELEITLDKNLFIGPSFNYFKYKMNEGEKNEIKSEENSNK